VEGLVSGYGKKQVLNGVSIEVMEGEIVALIGHNGAGKSTLLKTVFGLLPAWKGQMTLDGKGLTSPTPRELLGLYLVPPINRGSGSAIRIRMQFPTLFFLFYFFLMCFMIARST
jgi:ABC-type branched-subunit amino acid transport system ATPase component